MNDTKKITQGAVLIAIAGALIFIDKLTSFIFSPLIVLMVPVVVIIYSTMHSVKDGLVFSVALLIVTIIVGLEEPMLMYVIFVPIGIVAGIIYSVGLRKGLNRKVLMLIMMIIYVVGEIISAYVILPLAGITISSQIGEISELMDNTLFKVTNFKEVFNMANIVVGVIEGFVLNLLAVFLLRRLKIWDVKNGSLINLKPNKILAYVCALLAGLLFFMQYIENEMLMYIISAFGFVAVLVLAFYGYIYCILYMRMVIKRNLVFIIILATVFLLPISLIILAAIGFLYNSGPLYELLIRKAEES